MFAHLYEDYDNPVFFRALLKLLDSLIKAVTIYSKGGRISNYIDDFIVDEKIPSIVYPT